MPKAKHQIAKRAVTSQAGPRGSHVVWCSCGKWSGSAVTKLAVNLKFDDHCIEEDE